MFVPNTRLKYAFLLCASLFTSAASAFMGIGPADQPQQQRDRGNLPCPLVIDPFEVHLVTYLVSASGSTNSVTPYCNDLPAPGRVYFAIDLLDRKLRSMPIKLRIETTAEPASADPTLLLAKPAQYYPQGVIEGSVEFAKPGDGVLVLSVARASGEIQEVRFQLHIGNASLPQYLVMLTLSFVLLSTMWRWWRMRWK